MASKEDILRKVRALLDRAAGTNFEAERDACLAKADELMLAYQIESFELEMAKDKGSRTKPEVRVMEYGTTGDRDVDGNLHTMFYYLAEHIGCKIGAFGWSASKVVGYSEDLDYLDLLFTNLRLHMAMTMVPRVQKELTYPENLALLKEAGYKWQKIWELMVPYFPDSFKRWEIDRSTNAEYLRRLGQFGAGERSLLHLHYIFVGDRVFPKTMPRPAGVRFTKEYTDFCAEHGRERVYSSPETYRRNFSQAYVMRIVSRIREWRTARDTAAKGHEIVLRNRLDDLTEFFYTEFPNLRPHPAGCDCDQCHYCGKKDCRRPRCVDARRPVRYKSSPESKYDAVAARRGREAANTADLTAGRSNIRQGSRGELK